MQHAQNRCSLFALTTLPARTTKPCVSTFDTSSLSHVKNNSILAIFSTVLLPPGRSTNRCEYHKSDFSMTKAATAPWDSLASSSILPLQPHLCRLTVTGGTAAAQHLLALHSCFNANIKYILNTVILKKI